MDRVGEKHVLDSGTRGDRPQATLRVPDVVHPGPPTADQAKSPTMVTADSNQGPAAGANISLPEEEGEARPNPS